jgi:hypothetical protein
MEKVVVSGGFDNIRSRDVRFLVVDKISGETVRQMVKKEAQAIPKAKEMVYSNGGVQICLVYGRRPRFVRGSI